MTLTNKTFLSLQTEVIAIKNACGPRANVNDREQRSQCPDDLVLRYRHDIQQFVGHTVSAYDSTIYLEQRHSYRASAYQVVYNITEILDKHIKSGLGEEELDLRKILDNLNALKRHRYNPSAAGNAYINKSTYQWVLKKPKDISYFVINNDVGMYLLAKRLHRCLILNSDNNIFKQDAFQVLINNLDDEIKKHENNNDFRVTNNLFLEKYQLFSNNNVISKLEMITFAEREFTDIYKQREEFAKHLSINKSIFFVALRLLATLSVTACVVGICFAFSEIAGLILIFMAVPVILLNMHLSDLTYLPLSISESEIQKNNEKYNELQAAINKEFGPDTHTKTTEALIEEQSLRSGPQYGEQHYWLSLVTPSQKIFN